MAVAVGPMMNQLMVRKEVEGGDVPLSSEKPVFPRSDTHTCSSPPRPLLALERESARERERERERARARERETERERERERERESVTS